MSSMLEIGITSLFASKYALTMASNNIANAADPAYSRREVDFSEAHYNVLGNGVKITDIRRIVDDLANKNLLASQSNWRASDTYVQKINDLSLYLEDDKTSVAHFINESLTALQSLTSDASSLQARNLYLAQLANVVNRFHSVNDNLNQQYTDISSALNADVAMINTMSQRLAAINEQIVKAPFASPANMPLLDERDKLLATLATYINVETTTDDRGVMNVQLGNGTPLVLGNQTLTLVRQPVASNPLQSEIMVQNGSTFIPITNLITGGDIAGLLSYQTTALDEASHGLDRLALVVAQKMNQQHQLGIDLTGRLGAALFNDINTPPVTLDRVSANTNNQGTGDLSAIINDAGLLTTSDYELRLTSASDYQLIRLSDEQVLSNGTITGSPYSITADGFSLVINNANFAAGDSFTIAPTKHAAANLQLALSDASQLALGWPVVSASSPQNQGQGTITLTAITDNTNPAFATPQQLTPPVRIEFTSPTSYRLINLQDNSVIDDNLAYSPTGVNAIFPSANGYDPGYRVNVSGVIQTGDQFTLNYNSNGIGDNRNGLALADLYQAGVVQDNSLTFSQGYHYLSGDIAAKTNAAKIMLTSNDIIKNQAQLRRDQVSGVSLEEETMNLARFQQTYQASAQIIDAVNNMFDVVIGLGRR